MTTTTTTTEIVTKTVCPSWCIGTKAEHEFEAEHNHPVQHFMYIRGKSDQSERLIPSISVTLTINPDGEAVLSIGVEDDEYDVGMAERVAWAMLEAVKVARS
jgi:hypothetical protein